MAKTIVEIVQEFNSDYASKVESTPKGQKGELWENIFQKVWKKYKKDFDLTESEFKSLVRTTQYELSQEKKEAPKFSSAKNKPDEIIDEGSGWLFTKKQIEDFNLNEDSY